MFFYPIKIIFMVITIFGATGQVGKRAVYQALVEGHTVKAFGRNVDDLIDEDLRNQNFEAIKGHVFDEADVLHAVTGSHAVLSTLGGNIDGVDKTRSLGMKNIIFQMQRAGVKRIVALGGSGVLNVENGTYLMEAVDYNPQFRAVSLEHLEAYLLLKNSSLEWTFVASPNILDKDKTENYIINANYLPSPNIREIAAGDIADFMLHELSNNKFVHQKVGISRL